MCIVGYFVSGVGPRSLDYAVCASRDEGLRRSTSPTRFREQDSLVCGVDRVAGGTWHGLGAATGRHAVLTNVDCENEPGDAVDRVSRGLIVLSELCLSAGTRVRDAPLPRITGFNLMVADLKAEVVEPTFFTNCLRGGPLPVRSSEVLEEHRIAGPATGGFSNGRLNEWDKVNRLTAMVERAVAAAGDASEEEAALLRQRAEERGPATPLEEGVAGLPRPARELLVAMGEALLHEEGVEHESHHAHAMSNIHVNLRPYGHPYGARTHTVVMRVVSKGKGKTAVLAAREVTLSENKGVPPELETWKVWLAPL